MQDTVDAALHLSGAATLPPRPPEELPRRRRSRSRRSRRPRVRRPSIRVVAASALVAALVGAWVVVLRADDSPSAPVPVPDVPVTTGAPIPGGRVEYSQPGNATEAYRAVAGPDDGVAARGDAACARGVPEERAWSKPRARGRSRSLFVSPRRQRAEMWWTETATGVLAHAVREDGDLAALFTWWRSQRDDASAEDP